MSMLAERKRKQKWSLNPRGKEWSQDVNKFGQKMLEKMGWQQGKGLGAKEDGITEHIKVSYKNDSKGMGYNVASDQWTEHETNFTALLESLAGTVEKRDQVKLRSLEKKSESSRVRVHYHKFTRGKDLSSFSFHAGSMKDYFKKKMPTFGKSNGLVVGSNGVLKREESDSEQDARPSFSFSGKGESDSESNQYTGFGFKSEVKSGGDAKTSTFISYVNGDGDSPAQKKKKKKRNAEENEESSPKRSRRNSSKTPLTESVRNPAFDPLYTPIKIQKHVLTTIEETEQDSLCTVDSEIEFYKEESKTETPKKAKKKKGDSIDVIKEEDSTKAAKKKKKRKKTANKNPVEEPVNTLDFNPCELRVKKKKKKEKKDESAVDNPTFDATADESTDLRRYDIVPNPYEVQVLKQNKKKKEKRNKEGESVSQCVENGHEGKSSKRKEKSGHENSETEDAPRKRKKNNREEMDAIDNPGFNDSMEMSVESAQVEGEAKKKKKKKAALALENPSFEDCPEDSSGSQENAYEVKRKKKKELKLALENPAFDDAVDSSSVIFSEENPFEVKKKEEYALDNPHFNPNDSPEAEPGNNAFEVERKKKKSKKRKEESGVVNPALDLDSSSAEIKENVSVDVEESDLMLNIVTTPILAKPKAATMDGAYSITKVTAVKRRKSVRFSDVTQELIIPNNDDLRNLSDVESRNELFDINAQVLNSSMEEQSLNGNGLDNLAFDRRRNRLEENVESMAKTLDSCQAEVENDINERRLEELVVGEVGNPHGENERLPDGTRLKFKYAHFATLRTPFYQLDKVGAKKSYRHLIKGDIVVKFSNTNLHQIDGYGVKKGAVA
ncbi:hypothetical protein NQ318_015068 [Aromia moschata]|uniref:G-patch domain-containing protein n=1 Tax=Aromia moschata TaxID=1265417 RepID=A0AAV8YYZ4_9CUCU|nr:hypothetical protein NQ318_015068 [Aromia moschata]